MRRPLLCLLVAAALAGGGCGSDSPLEVGEAWMEAVAAGDAGAACSLMDPSATESIVGRYTDQPAGTDCEEAVRAYAEAFDARKAEILIERGLEAGERVDGGDVGIFAADPRYESDILLTRERDGEWRVVSVGIAPR
jgi:hypothetical protein